jgi:deoxyribonucleoside regulator
MQDSDPRAARLAEIARAYYLENRTQAEIARSLGISRSQVSRHLSEARAMGIVQIRIVAPGRESDELGESLQQRYPHLQAVVVAPVFDDEPETVRTIIGRYAAEYVTRVVQTGHHLALGCGRTLRAMVNAMPKRHVSNVSVVQAMGSIGHEAHNIDYNEIAHGAAEALGARAYYITAPAILGNGSGLAPDFVAANPMVRKSLSFARQADIYVVGLGSLESDQIYARTGLIGQHELDDLQGRAVGDICGRFFNLDGSEQPTAFSERIIGIELEDLRRAQLTIGVAGGSDKAPPLLGALRGRLINALVSDEQTVRSILTLDDALPAPL